MVLTHLLPSGSHRAVPTTTKQRNTATGALSPAAAVMHLHRKSVRVCVCAEYMAVAVPPCPNPLQFVVNHCWVQLALGLAHNALCFLNVLQCVLLGPTPAGAAAHAQGQNHGVVAQDIEVTVSMATATRDNTRLGWGLAGHTAAPPCIQGS